MNTAPVIVGIVMGLTFGSPSYKVAISKGRRSFAPFAAILGLPLGLIGTIIVLCVPSTAEAKRLQAQRKAGETQIPADLHKEHNLPT